MTDGHNNNAASLTEDKPTVTEEIKTFIHKQIQETENIEDLQNILRCVKRKKLNTTTRLSRKPSIEKKRVNRVERFKHLNFEWSLKNLVRCCRVILACIAGCMYIAAVLVVPNSYSKNPPNICLKIKALLISLRLLLHIFVVSLWFAFHLLAHHYLPAWHIVGKPNLSKTNDPIYRCNSTKCLLATSIVVIPVFIYLKLPIIQHVPSLFISTVIVTLVFFMFHVIIENFGCNNKVQMKNIHKGVLQTIKHLLFGTSKTIRYNHFDLKQFIEQQVVPLTSMTLTALFTAELLRKRQLITPSILCLILNCIVKLESVLYETNFIINQQPWDPYMGYINLVTDYILPIFTPFVAIGCINLQRMLTSRIRIITALLTFIAGYFINRISNSENRKLYLIEIDSSLANRGNLGLRVGFLSENPAKTITIQKKNRLPMSGMWAICRHPDILAQILIEISMAVLASSESLIPWFYLMFYFLVHVIPIVESERQCTGKQYDRYTQNVHYAILPPLY
ncbi:hypothetical protein GJ496_006509 [Pomphorhynchus laevis]|nr:hypothetical protein GJ496_006509 [Pomphorhynchus laevis]